MCKLMEDRLDEREYNRNIQIAVNLLAMGDLTHEKIAKATELTVAEIEEIAKQLKASKVQ